MKKSDLILAICIALTPAIYAQEVDEILVYGQQMNSETETGSRLGLTLIETPASVDIIDGDVIRSRIETTVIGTVTRSAGFTNQGSPGNGGTSVAARGFRGQGVVTKLYDGTNYYTAFGTITFPFDTWGVERIEVLKGPSSVLYGEGGVGGAINVIPKSPTYESEGDLRLTAGENSTLGLGLGIGGGLSETVAYRLDVSHQESDGWVNDGESDSQMISGALQWDAAENLSLTARFDYGDQSPMKYFGTPVINGDFVDDLAYRNFNVSDGQISYEDQALRLKADWTIDDASSFAVEVFQLESDRLWSNSEYSQYDPIANTITQSEVYEIGHEMEQNGVRFDYQRSNELGGIEVRSSFGLEMNEIDFVRPSNFGPGSAGATYGTNVIDLENYDAGTIADITDAPFVDHGFSNMSQHAIYGEAQAQLTDELSLVAGLRAESIDTDYLNVGSPVIEQSVSPLTGRLGFVYTLNDDAVVYGQYSTGATHASGGVVNTRASYEELDLIDTEQLEIGIKQAGLDGRLQWSVALFDITKNNLTEDDPTSSDPDVLIIIGEQTSQGIELGFNFNLGSAISTYGNAVFLNAETDTGETPRLVPEQTLNLGVAYAATDMLNAYVDLRQVGEQYHATNPVPSYTVVDASLAYEVNEDFVLTLRADNLFDKLYATTGYFSDTWLVGQPRTFSLTADYSF